MSCGIWNKVATLNDADPNHYTARIGKSGTSSIHSAMAGFAPSFASGNNNVRMTLSQGVRSRRNLAPYSLEKEEAPCSGRCINSHKPQPAATITVTLHDHAPARLTPERAVSLADLRTWRDQQQRVAGSRLPTPTGWGRVERIEVAVVPAGGGSLGTLGDTLQAFLIAHALPGVKVTVVPYQSVILDLKLTLRIKEEEYDPIWQLVSTGGSYDFSRRAPNSATPCTGAISLLSEGVEGVASVNESIKRFSRCDRRSHVPNASPRCGRLSSTRLDRDTNHLHRRSPLSGWRSSPFRL